MNDISFDITMTYEGLIVKVSIELKNFLSFYRRIWTKNAQKRSQKTLTSMDVFKNRAFI